MVDGIDLFFFTSRGSSWEHDHRAELGGRGASCSPQNHRAAAAGGSTKTATTLRCVCLQDRGVDDEERATVLLRQRFLRPHLAPRIARHLRRSNPSPTFLGSPHSQHYTS